MPKRRTPWLPTLLPASTATSATSKASAKASASKHNSKAPSQAALAWAERNARHLATQGELQALRVVNATGNNLKGVSAEFPVGLLTCVTGVSGSGKSTLVNDTLYAAVARQLYRAHDEPAAHESIEGIEHFDKCINVDQSPHWPHAAQQPGHLHRLIHAHSRADGRGAHRARARLRPGAL